MTFVRKAWMAKVAVLALLSIVLASCGGPAATQAANPTAAVQAQATVEGYPAPADTAYPAAGQGSATTYSDPFTYCGAVGTVDTPGPAYTGPQTPEAVVKGLMQAAGVSADMPKDVFAQGTFWRCMGGQVYGCFVGANLPCDSKANTDQTPTAAEQEFCKANPSADAIPAAVTGHDTVYEWACQDGAPQIVKQVFQVDAQGYIQEIWYPIPAVE